MAIRPCLQGQTRNGRLTWLFILMALAFAVLTGGVLGLENESLRAGILAAPVAAVALVVGLRRPEWLFYALIGLVFLLGVSEGALLSETVLYLGVGGLLLLSLALRRVTHRERIAIDGQSAMWAALFAAWAIIPALRSPQFTLIRVYWLVVILFFIPPIFIKTPKQLLTFIWVILLVSAMASAILLWEQLNLLLRTGFSNFMDLYRGLDSETALDAGGILSVRLSKALPLALALFFAGGLSSRPRAALTVIAALVLGASVLTVSSNGLVGVFITVFLLSFLLPKRRDRIVVTLLLIGGLLLANSLALDVRLVQQVELIASGEDFFRGGSTRGLKFYMAWQSILASPWLGYGPGQAGNVLPNFVPFEYLNWGRNGEFTVPHNMLLSIWVELGVAGLFLFLGLYGSVCVRLWRATRRLGSGGGRSLYEMIGYGILITLIVFFIQGMFISIQTEKLMWILLGSGVAFVRLVDKGVFSEPGEPPDPRERVALP